MTAAAASSALPSEAAAASPPSGPAEAPSPPSVDASSPGRTALPGGLFDEHAISSQDGRREVQARDYCIPPRASIAHPWPCSRVPIRCACVRPTRGGVPEKEVQASQTLRTHWGGLRMETSLSRGNREGRMEAHWARAAAPILHRVTRGSPRGGLWAAGLARGEGNMTAGRRIHDAAPAPRRRRGPLAALFVFLLAW